MRIISITAALLDLGEALRAGDVETIAAAVAADPMLASAYFGTETEARSALHLVTDFPGHIPNVTAMIATLVAAGADVNAPFIGKHSERPLHWAASCDDVEAIEALLAAGADIEAPGGVHTDGPPLDDAVIFAQWDAARLLVDRGAVTNLFHAAALDLTDRVAELLASSPPVQEVTNALWHAGNGGALGTARLLLAAGGDPSWLGHDHMTPLDAARESGNAALVELLERSS